MTIEQVVDAYFAGMRAKDIAALKALYTEDATFVLPDGREFNGIDAIAGMHQGVFAAGAPVPSVGAKIIGDNAAAAEVEAKLPDGSSRFTTNHFYLDAEGRIEKLNVYMKAPLS